MINWQEDETAWEFASCNFCGTPSEDLISVPFPAEAKDTNQRIFSMGKWRFVECPKCRLRFYSPRLKQDDRWLDSCMRNDGSRKQAETVLKYGGFWPNDDPAKQIAFIKEIYKKYLLRCEKMIGRKPRKIFDIGCNVGRLLDTAREIWTGCWVIGCDPNPFAVEICDKQGIPAEESLFKDTVWNEPIFDVVVGWNLIEHTYTPWDDIQKAYAITSPGGILILRTFHEEGNSDGYQSGPIAHAHHFFKDVLKNMVATAGFEVKVEEHGERDFFVFGIKP